MKSIKETARNMRRQEESSEQENSKNVQEMVEISQQPIEQEIPSSEPVQQSLPQSQQRSSDIMVSSPIYDPEVGYEKGHYKIEKIKFRRWNLQKRQFEYLIKWQGYSDKQCTWQSTQDIIGEPCLQLKDLGRNTLLPIFERTHAKTIIYDEENNKNIRDYQQSRKNHLKYAPKQLIEEMDREMQDIYGNKNYQSNTSKKQQIQQSSKQPSTVKLQFENAGEEENKSKYQEIESSQVLHGYQVKNITIQKLLYFPLQFELKILIRSNSNPKQKRFLTCDQMMNIDPQTAIFCYKTKLAMIQKWKIQNLIKTTVNI